MFWKYAANLVVSSSSIPVVPDFLSGFSSFLCFLSVSYVVSWFLGFISDKLGLYTNLGYNLLMMKITLHLFTFSRLCFARSQVLLFHLDD